MFDAVSVEPGFGRGSNAPQVFGASSFRVAQRVLIQVNKARKKADA
jgi:hypothetical protein